MPLFTPFQDKDYVCSVWFERDRRSVSLETPNGRTVFRLQDDDFDQAVEDGFLVPPHMAAMSSRALNDAAAWQPSAVAYARGLGLI